jgi:hypothetical protein
MSPMRAAPAALTASDEQLRAQYLNEVLGILYPAPCRTTRGNVREPVAEYLVVPNARKPRLLVPAGDRRLAAAAVRRYAEPTSRLARIKRNAVVAALRTGASAALLRDRVRVDDPGDTDTFERYLNSVLNRDCVISVHIGPARANRKPVLQVLDPSGRTVAFVKLGTTGLTRQLVRAETTALVALGNAGLTSISVPPVLHSGQWHGHEVLVQGALPVWRPRAALTGPRLSAAMKELAGCCGTRRGTLEGSGYATRLRARLDAVADQPDGAALAAATARIFAAAAGSTPAPRSGTHSTTGVRLQFGAWHGDWSPWNMATLDDTLLVWDWERFTPGVPLGFDAVHHDLQVRLTDGGDDARAAVDGMLAAAPNLLLPFGVVEPRAVEVTALLYLVDLATRYVADRQAEAGARLGVLGTWLLPALLSRVEVL